MKNKPFLIFPVIIGLVLVPVMFYIRLSYAYEFVNFEIAKIGMFFAVALAIISFSIAYGIWQVRLWGMYSFAFLAFATVVLDLYVWLVAKVPFDFWLVSDLVAAGAGVALLLNPKVRAPYYNPKIRWWETPQRVKTEIPAALIVEDSKKDISILDISLSGCFAGTESMLDAGKTIPIEIRFESIHFTSNAEVIRQSQNPKGLGLMFTNMTKENSESIKKIVEKLKSQSAPV